MDKTGKTGYNQNDHTFVICASGEDKKLESTIRSLLAQTVKGNIVIATATPNMYIFSIATKYDLQVFINEGKSIQDNELDFAYLQADTPLVTITRQGDIYETEFLEKTLEAANSNPDMIISFTDYYLIKDGKKCMNDRQLVNKRLMLLPMLLKGTGHSKFARRRILSFGNPIYGSSVTFNRINAGAFIFDESYGGGSEYKAWETLSSREGRFIYIPDALTGHRIYAQNEQTEAAGMNKDKKDEFEVLKLFWPQAVAKVFNFVHERNEKREKGQSRE